MAFVIVFGLISLLLDLPIKVFFIVCGVVVGVINGMGGHAYVQRLVGCNVATDEKKLSAFFADSFYVCLFLSEDHKLADDIVKYQHNNVCHYLCYPIVEAEK